MLCELVSVVVPTLLVSDTKFSLNPTYPSLPSGDSDGVQLAKFCGHTIPRIPIVVFTPELWVHFQTDSSQGDLGFKAKYFFSGKTVPSFQCVNQYLEISS